MKKILVVVLTFFLFSCSINDINEISNTNLDTNMEINNEQIMKGNFSSIAGEYVNPKGDVINIDYDGLRDNERQTSEIIFNNNIYTMGIHPKNQDSGGYLLMIFPKGIEVPNLEGLTDTNKIRICYGQADPMSIDEIYTKK